MAAPVNVRLRIDHSRMESVVGGVTHDAVQQAAEISRDRYKANLRADDLINTGKLINSITTATVPRGALSPAVAVGSPLDYVKYPEFGTRAHGPVRAKALRFKPKGSSSFVFAKWVRGVKPYGFARRTLDQIRPNDFM